MFHGRSGRSGSPVYISTDEKIVDILVKPLSKIKFSYLRDKLGLMEISPLVEMEEITSSVGREH
jgi:hypothetical protein